MAKTALLESLAISLHPEAVKVLKRAARKRGMPVKKLLETLVLEYLEDFEDGEEAEKAMKEPGECISLEELKEKYGL